MQSSIKRPPKIKIRIMSYIALFIYGHDLTLVSKYL